MNLRFFTLTLLACACIGLSPQAFAQAGNDNPGGVTAEYYGSVTTAGQYDPYTGNARREIDDIVVPGAIGAYPLKYTRTMNTRSLPVGWTGNYTWGVSIYDPHTNNCTDFHTCGPDGLVVYPGGSSIDLETPTTPGIWPLGVNGRHGADDVLVQCSIVNSGCELGAAVEIRRADGGKVLFERLPSAGNVNRAYAIIDPYGQRTTLTYYNPVGYTIWKVTEPGGRYLEFIYGQTGLSTVQANDGRGNIMESVNYSYGQISHVYYADGAVATYTYVTPNNSMPGQTPVPNLIHSCDDPRYAGPMKYIEYEYVPWTEVANVGRGQIKAEKNILGQRVSSTTYPPAYANPWTDPNWYRRTETRGDGKSRTISYGNSLTWTDFENQTYTDTNFATPSAYGWTMTDPRGNTTTYEQENALGALRKITYPQTDPSATPATKEYTFSNPSQPYFHSGEKDENGNWTYFDRDGNNRVWRIRYPDQSTEEFTYNGFGQVLAHRPRSMAPTVTDTNLWENLRYDGRGLKTLSWPAATESDPAPWTHPSQFFYYTSGPNTDRLQRVEDARHNSTWYEYNQRGQVTKVTHPDGTYTQSAYNVDGTLAWTADENHPGAVNDPNQRTRYTYDEYKRVLTVTNPMGETTTNWYGLDANWQNPLLHTTNSPKYILSPMGKNVVYEYDANFRKTYQGVALGTPDANETRFDYDEVGNLNWTRDPRWNVTTFGYDVRNRQISMDDALPGHRNASGHTTNWQYDNVGNKTREIRTDNAFRSWDYDSMNRLAHATEWRMSTAEPAVTTGYAYNTTSRVQTITDPKLNNYVIEFDELGRKTKETYPPDVGQAARFEKWGYDIAGNLNSYTNRSGAKKQFAAYDNRNRPTSFAWQNEPPGQSTQGQSFEYDAASRVTALHNAEADITFGYDAANRKTSETETIRSYGLNQTHTVTYGYNADGARSQIVYPGGWDYRYSYTNRNQLASIGLSWSGTPTVAYTYDMEGNRSRRTIYYGAYTDYSYNAINQLTSQTSYFNGSTGRFDYGFDGANRLKYEQRDSGVADGFGFDPRNELTAFNQNGTLNGNGTVSAAYNVSITYDANGNRIEAFDGNHAPYSTVQNNQYSSDWTGTLTYDGNANLTWRAGWTFSYDAQNRLVKIQGGGMTINYHYDPLNRIVAWDQNNSITTQVWDDWNPIEEHSSNDNFQRMYLHGAAVNEIVGSYGPAWGDAFYFQDGRGNVTHMTGPGNNVIEHYTYFVSGQPNYLMTSGMNNRFLFKGAMFVSGPEIYDMRNRFYLPNLGRFMQSDPIGFDAGDMNLFRYCGNDPVDGSDPTGLVDMQSGSTVAERMRLFYGDNLVQESLYDLDHRTPTVTMAGQYRSDASGSSGRSPRLQTSKRHQALKYTTLGAPTKTKWQIRWGLTHPSKSGGWIVQHIQADFKGLGPREYWEAWEVMPGDQGTTSFSWYGSDDTFGGAPGTQILGTARFYEGLRLPSSFAVGSVDTANLLRATYVNPHLSTANATAPNTRWWEAQ